MLVSRTLALAVVAVALFTRPVLAETLTVTIAGIETDEGRIMAQLMRGERQFSGAQRSAALLDLAAQVGAVTIRFESLPPGEYGIRAMHDRNGNGELERNLVGVPTEPWAFSNDASGSFGPPGWAAAKFVLEGEARHTLRFRR